MTLIDDIVNSRSVSVVGLEKNTGKTECLNYIIRNLPVDRVKVAVTSIGVDGEGVDIVTGTHKPEVFFRSGMLFSTSEKHYRQRHIFSELLDVSDENTALGRVVTARAMDYGKVMLSGPSTGKGLERWMKRMKSLGADLTLVDGAVSRLSSASPSVSEALVLSTGAAFSANLPELVRKTLHVVRIVMSPEYEGPLSSVLSSAENGLWTISPEGNVSAVEGCESALSLSGVKDNIVRGNVGLYVSGALTDRIADRVLSDGAGDGFVLVAKDFTKVFLSQAKLALIARKGIGLRLLSSSRLLAVCVNPVSPNGIVLDSERLCDEMRAVLPVPVYDLFRPGC